jgi:hypothetical protein
VIRLEPYEGQAVPAGCVVSFDGWVCWAPDLERAMRDECPICSGAVPSSIHHPSHAQDDAHDLAPKTDEAPADTGTPSGSTPESAGGSRDWRNRTQP